MPALHGKKQSSVRASKDGKNVGAKMVVMFVIAALLVEALAMVGGWKFFGRDIAYKNFLEESSEGQYQVLRAKTDIAPGESISDKVERIVVPGKLATSNAVPVGTDISGLRASGQILGRTIITTGNTYDPKLQDVVIGSSRQVGVEYIETPGIKEGDYIDIRLKVYRDTDKNYYRDEIVCAKKEVLYKNETDGRLELVLSESDILNLNKAVVEAVDETQVGTLYVTKYVDPAKQPKASITYTGKGVVYSPQELLEAQQKLKDIQSGEAGYAEPKIDRSEKNVEAEGGVQ